LAMLTSEVKLMNVAKPNQSVESAKADWPKACLAEVAFHRQTIKETTAAIHHGPITLNMAPKTIININIILLVLMFGD
jgi:hypothetical protein